LDGSAEDVGPAGHLAVPWIDEFLVFPAVHVDSQSFGFRGDFFGYGRSWPEELRDTWLSGIMLDLINF